jgi:uncharacterized protein (UPF0333 family)
MIAVGFARIIFAIWCALGTVCSAWELDKEHPPTGELGVRLDYHLARTWPTALVKKGRQIPRTFTWSSHLTFEKDVSALEPSDLWQIAHDAYAEMKTNMALYKMTAKKDTPRAMTVLAVGNEIFLASSMKNGANFAFAYPKTKVSTTLEQCQTTFHKNGGESTKGHKNQASCGEVMSAQMYYTTEKNKDTLLEDREARVCTVVLDKEDNPQNTDPCSDLVSNSEYPQICGFS